MDRATELQWFHTAMGVWVLVAVVVVALLTRMTAPYGRHTRSGWGPTVSSTLGWVLMEAPSPLVMLAWFAVGDRQAWGWLMLWWLHYGYRAFVYPFLRRGGQRPMPLSVVAMGATFNVVNATLQGRWLFTLGPEVAPGWHTLLGGGLFLAGWMTHVNADAVLRALRKPGDTSYRVPQGGLYRWVSCPNYLGELVQWSGWALATWSLPGLVFALWTAANLAPRALSNHRWYLATFPDYPRERRALIPGIF